MLPLSVKMPVPAFVSDPPPAPLIWPARAVSLLSPPVVSVFALSCTVPPAAPASEPIVSLASRLSWASDAMVTALASGIAVPKLTRSTPALTFVAPL